ncbi:uncharacterized protein LOC124190178 [Daphnia pulex]|uniref:uncharacterized protein LOC124190178 n=1 Tax=Daphnia pulex TaxID=6669 RepID=UPI001EDD8853|nr:uncharacterized protein LOC124190178 [Daphnia pulex]
MWKKGSYDVSGKQEQHDSNRLSVVVLSDNHHGETLINVEKSGPSNRLKWFPELRENLLIQLVAALFLVIFVLIGVIIWLSVSIHLSNRDSLRTISTAVDLLTGQHVNTKPEPCSTDAPQTGQSRAIPCDTLFRATFEFTEHGLTVDEERDSGKSSSVPSHLTGTTTIRSMTRESFSLKGTSYQMKGSSCNNCQIILQKSPINKTGENLRIAEDEDSESEEEISDEIDDDDDIAKAVEIN